jgi:hypothetical protein
MSTIHALILPPKFRAIINWKTFFLLSIIPKQKVTHGQVLRDVEKIHPFVKKKLVYVKIGQVKSSQNSPNAKILPNLVTLVES